MVRMTIHNQVNQNDEPIGISFRRKDKLSGDVIWSVFEKVPQYYSRCNALDTLVVNIRSVNMPVGFDARNNSMGRPLSVNLNLKRNIIEIRN